MLAWINATARVSAGEAEEIRQLAFLRLVREVRGGMRYRVPFGAAMYRVAGWTTLGFVKSAAKRGERESRLGDDEHDQPADMRPVREMDQVGEDDDVAALFAGLPDRERQLMILVYLEDHSLAQAAHAMDITDNNAHQIHHRAKSKLMQIIAEEGR